MFDSAPVDCISPADVEALIFAWVALLPVCRGAPNLQVSGGGLDKWLNWAYNMGSASPADVSLRARIPAKSPAVLDF